MTQSQRIGAKFSDLVGIRGEIESWFLSVAASGINLNFEETSRARSQTNEPRVMGDAHLLIEKSFKILMGKGHGHDLGTLFKEFRSCRPFHAGVLEAAHQEALEWYHYGPFYATYCPQAMPESEKGIGTLQEYLDTHGRSIDYEGFRYPHESKLRGLWTRAKMPLHYEILHCLKDLVLYEHETINHGATSNGYSIKERVNREVIETIVQAYTDKVTYGEMVKFRRRAPEMQLNDSFLHAAHEGFDSDDGLLRKTMRDAYKRLLAHSDIAVRFFGGTVVTVPPGKYSRMPEYAGFNQPDYRIYRIHANDGSDIGHVSRIRTGRVGTRWGALRSVLRRCRHVAGRSMFPSGIHDSPSSDQEGGWHCLRSRQTSHAG